MNSKMPKERQELVIKNRRLVGYVMARMNLRVPNEDAYAAGCLGLCRAAAIWAEGGGTAFSTFACHMIRHRIIDCVRRETRDLHLEPASLRGFENRLARPEEGFGTVENRDLVRSIDVNANKILPPDECTVVRLLLRQAPPAGIAEKLGVSVATVYETRLRAANRLRQAGMGL